MRFMRSWAHIWYDGKQKGVYFAVWAPHAQAVSVVGEFNDWDHRANPMKREEPLGIYTLFYTRCEEGSDV